MMSVMLMLGNVELEHKIVELQVFRPAEREYFIDNLLARIHSIIDMNLVDRPCAMGV